MFDMIFLMYCRNCIEFAMILNVVCNFSLLDYKNRRLIIHKIDIEVDVHCKNMIQSSIQKAII